MPTPWSETSDGWRSFRGGRAWRLTPDGIEVEGEGLPRTKGAPTTITRIMTRHADDLVWTARHYGIGVDLLCALVAVETSPKGDPRSLRMEPGYESDEATPHRVSVGLLQCLISSANMVGKLTPWGKGPSRADLMDPRQGLAYGAALLRYQYDEWQGDPVLASCVLNAGGAYESSKSDWNLRTYGEHRIIETIRWLNDWHGALRDGLFALPYARLVSMPANPDEARADTVPLDVTMGGLA